LKLHGNAYVSIVYKYVIIFPSCFTFIGRHYTVHLKLRVFRSLFIWWDIHSQNRINFVVKQKSTSNYSII